MQTFGADQNENRNAVGSSGVRMGSAVQAQDSWNFPDFTATQVFPSRRADLTMKVYRSGSSVRVERSAAISTL